MKHRQVCLGSFIAIQIVDPVDVPKTYSYSAACQHHVPQQVQSHRWCYFELWLQRRNNGWKTYTSLWRISTRRYSNNLSKLLALSVWTSFQLISMILSWIWDLLGCGSTRWICILITRHHVLSNPRRPRGCMCRTTITPNLNDGPFLIPNMISTATSSLLQRPLHLVNHLLIHIICPLMMMNSKGLNASQNWYPEESIMQHTH